MLSRDVWPPIANKILAVRAFIVRFDILFLFVKVIKVSKVFRNNTIFNCQNSTNWQLES